MFSIVVRVANLSKISMNELFSETVEYKGNIVYVALCCFLKYTQYRVFYKTNRGRVTQDAKGKMIIRILLEN